MSKKTTNYRDIKFLAKLLDNQLEGPFNISVGLDSIIGLIPFWGDLIMLVTSLYIFLRAVFLGCSPPILIKILINIFIDFTLGTVPIAGDIFDIYWQANNKNVDLIIKYIDGPHETHVRSSIQLKTTALVIFSLFAILTFFTIKGIQLFISLLI